MTKAAKASAAKKAGAKKAGSKAPGNRRILSLVSQIAEAVRQIASVDPDGPKLSPGKPATEATIARYEKALGFAFPPSYRTFLALHDGYRGLGVTADLLSPSHVVAGGRRHSVIRRWQRDENLAHATVIAEDDASGDFVYLDSRKRTKDGECRVVAWSHDDDADVFPSFEAYLKECRVAAREWVRDAPSLVAADAARAREKEAAAARANAAAKAKATAGAKQVKAPSGEYREFGVQDSEYTCAAISHDGALIATGDYFNVRLWDAATGVLRATYALKRGPAASLAFDRDGLLVAAAAKSILVWDVIRATDEEAPLREVLRKGYSCAAFVPGRREILALDKPALVAWSIDSGKGAPIAPLSSLRSFAIAADTIAFCAIGKPDVVLWSRGRRKELRTIACGEEVHQVKFSDDGKVLATVHLRSCRTWDVSSGSALCTFSDPDLVYDLAFAQSGSLVTSSRGKIRVWDSKRGVVNRTLEGSSHNVSVAFDPTRGVLVGAGKSVRLWNLR